MGLPSGYKQVEYIEASGTQYINTGFNLTSNSRLVIDMDVTAASDQKALFGSRTSSNAGFVLFTYDNNEGYQSDFNTQQLYPVGGTSSGRHTIDKNREKLYQDGVLACTHTVSTFSTGYPAFLFSINKAGTAMSAYNSSGRIYSCQIYESDVLVRDFIPCINTSGAVGLYDTVNGSFHGNSGSGVFTAGNVVETGLPGRVNIGGAWKTLTKGYVNVGGIWKPIVAGYVNVNGVWKLLWKAEKEILYTWKKYSVKTTTKYTYSEGAQTSEAQQKATALNAASSYTFNTNTGQFTLTNPTAMTFGTITTDTPYYMLDATTSNAMRKLVSKTTSVVAATLKHIPYNVSGTSTTSQGDYISDISSPDESAYPDNGIHTDGYWYVKQ